jgi:hypothetical protein
MLPIGPGRSAVAEALADDPVEVGLPAPSVAPKFERKSAVVTHPSPAPATAPSTSPASASFLPSELGPNRQSAIDLTSVALTSADREITEPANRCWTRLRSLVQGLEMF